MIILSKYFSIFSHSLLSYKVFVKFDIWNSFSLASINSLFISSIIFFLGIISFKNSYLLFALFIFLGFVVLVTSIILCFILFRFSSSSFWNKFNSVVFGTLKLIGNIFSKYSSDFSLFLYFLNNVWITAPLSIPQIKIIFFTENINFNAESKLIIFSSSHLSKSSIMARIFLFFSFPIILSISPWKPFINSSVIVYNDFSFSSYILSKSISIKLKKGIFIEIPLEKFFKIFQVLFFKIFFISSLEPVILLILLRINSNKEKAKLSSFSYFHVSKINGT